jgi:hypothetical protein
VTVYPPTEDEVFTPGYWKSRGDEASVLDIFDWLKLAHAPAEQQERGLAKYFLEHPDKVQWLPPHVREQVNQILENATPRPGR